MSQAICCCEILSAAMIRSPSFSRSMSSTTTRNSPLRKLATASSTESSWTGVPSAVTALVRTGAEDEDEGEEDEVDEAGMAVGGAAKAAADPARAADWATAEAMAVGAEDEPGLKLTEPDAVSRSPAETAFLPRPHGPRCRHVARCDRLEQ